MIDYNNHKVINKKGNNPLENAAQKNEKLIAELIKIDGKGGVVPGFWLQEGDP